MYNVHQFSIELKFRKDKYKTVYQNCHNLNRLIFNFFLDFYIMLKQYVAMFYDGERLIHTFAY